MRGAGGPWLGRMGGSRGRGFRRVGGYHVRWRPFGMWGWPVWGWGPGLRGMGCLLPLVGGIVVAGLALLRLMVS